MSSVLSPFSCAQFLFSLLYFNLGSIVSAQNEDTIGGLPVNPDYLKVREQVDEMAKTNLTHYTTFFTTAKLNISFCCKSEHLRLTEYSDDSPVFCSLSYSSALPILLTYKTDRPISLLLPQQNQTTLPPSLEAVANYSIMPKSEQLGLAYVLIYASQLNSTGTYEPFLVSGFRVVIVREAGMIDIIFRTGLIILFIIVTYLMGCDLDTSMLRQHLRKPIGPAIGFFCQFILMPTLAFALAKLTPISPEFGFGLFIAGCSPAGGSGKVWTRLLDGDMNLAVTMTLLSTLAAQGMIPLLVLTLGNLIKPLSVDSLPYGMIALQILLMFLPVTGGLLTRRFRPSLADKLRVAVKPSAFIFMLYVTVFGCFAYLSIYKLMVRYPLLVVVAAALPLSGYLLGFAFGRLLCRPWPVVTAISVSLGIPNSGVAILILMNAMPQPEGDLGAIMPIIVALAFSFLRNFPHSGSRANDKLLSDRFVWLGMHKDLKACTRMCPGRQWNKVQRHNKAPIDTSSTAIAQFIYLHLDIAGPVSLDDSCSFSLACVDRFIRWPKATLLPEVAAPTVVKALLSRWIAIFSVPIITSESSGQFESNFFQVLLSFLGTSVHHPAANGMVRRFHRRLKASLRTAYDPCELD
ncbi:hypothetical protein SprV_0802550200 [Sparganum proliferum]